MLRSICQIFTALRGTRNLCLSCRVFFLTRASPATTHRPPSVLIIPIRQYRQIYDSPDWPAANENLPWLHVLDDHEIANDWDSNTTGLYNAAIDPFNHYHHSINPPPVRPTGGPYYTFNYGNAASFFMLDTRTFRSPVTAPDGPEKTMLGELQRSDFLRWLSDGTGWKIVVSSVPWTKNWRVNGQDTWSGYLYERQIILEEMWRVGGGRVVVISGDRHEFAATAYVY